MTLTTADGTTETYTVEHGAGGQMTVTSNDGHSRTFVAHTDNGVDTTLTGRNVGNNLTLGNAAGDNILIILNGLVHYFNRNYITIFHDPFFVIKALDRSPPSSTHIHFLSVL